MTNLRARELRKTMTPHEIRLWAHLRQMKSHHFRRQAPIDGYVVDFADFGARLVIEVDGGQHGGEAHVAKDAQRDAHLKAAGFRVLRIWTSDIDGNLDGVMEAIVAALAE